MSKTAVATVPENKKPSLLGIFGARFNIDPAKVMDVLKATCFKQKDGQVSNEQMIQLLVVSDQYKLNPFTKEIYAFPGKNNDIIPVVSVDGWNRISNDSPVFSGIEFAYSDDIDETTAGKPCPEWIECRITRTDRQQPIVVREYLDECYRDVGPWNSHPKRMLRHKANIQCARIAFGFSGIYDQDEAERIVEVIDGQSGEITNKKVTPQSAAASSVPEGFDQYEADVLPSMQEAAKNGTESLTNEFGKLSRGANKSAFWTKHSKSLKESAELADKNIIDAEVVQ